MLPLTWRSRGSRSSRRRFYRCRSPVFVLINRSGWWFSTLTPIYVTTRRSRYLIGCFVSVGSIRIRWSICIAVRIRVAIAVSTRARVVVAILVLILVGVLVSLRLVVVCAGVFVL